MAGFNFGCGNSREQAATAYLAMDIPLVAAGGFGSIFSRNSINNAFMGVEVPRLVKRLREEFGEKVTDEADVVDIFSFDLRKIKVTVTDRESGKIPMELEVWGPAAECVGDYCGGVVGEVQVGEA